MLVAWEICLMLARCHVLYEGVVACTRVENVWWL